MKTIVAVCMVFGLMIGLFSSCGTPALCKVGDTKACTCLDLAGTQACKDDGSGFHVCRCGNQGDGGDKEAVVPDKSAENTPDQGASDEKAPLDQPGPVDEPAVADKPVSVDEPTSADEPMSVDTNTPELTPEPTPETIPEPVNCPSGEFDYLGQCYKDDDFCKGNISQPGFPAFSQKDQDSMQQPFVIEFDKNTRKPLFCQTKPGYYYLSGAGYGECDKDKDGWINIEAYRAVTSPDTQLQTNARCDLKKFKHIVYHAEGKPDQVQALDSEAIMVETFRNDGGGKQIELPIYSKNQAALPKGSSTACTADADCNGMVCYFGYCLEGRRFEPAELNTLTKGCISGLDLNDNKIDDANEGPGDTPDPAGEFKPLLTAGYFVELHYGNFQVDYDDNGTKIPVYHIYERPRNKTAALQGLAMNCQESTDAFSPDYWKTCMLKDNQKCQDPNDPTKTKPGLTNCWLKNTNRLLPSLFKCAVFDNANDKTTLDGYFHPDNYGFTSNYNRTTCSFKATINANDPTRRDIEFDCTVDDGTRKPDPTKKEVGWACLSFRNYVDSAGYLGGCIDEKAEKACGATKDNETVVYVTNEKDSYGMVRAYAPCGVSNGKGECDKAWRVCSGGNWLTCNKCDHCPQITTGQKTTCPSGTWPANSCKLLKGPSTEVCDGLDNNCDGQIDEGIATTRYYKDNDGDTYGDPAIFVDVCPAQKPAGYVARAGDCNDDPATGKDINPGIAEVCDGIDNNCNGAVDENQTFQNYYNDHDNDGFGEKTSSAAHRGCVKQGDNTMICKGKNDCISLTYTTGCKIGSCKFKTSSTDCCDTDANAKPGQTTYFSSKNACGGWDYNCNGTTEKGESGKTTTLNLCSCAKTVKYAEKAHAWCYTENEKSNNCGEKNPDNLSSSSEWNWDRSLISTCADGNCTATSTHGTSACLLNKTHAYLVTKNYDVNCKRNCKTSGSSTMSVNCSTDINNPNPPYTPKASDGSSNLIAMDKTMFGSEPVCHFLRAGGEPDCGQTTETIKAADVESAPPSYDSGSQTVCHNKKKNCTVNWEYWCKYYHTVSYSSDYKYFKESSVGVGVQVGCR